jgi:hypothetical protein
MSQKENDNVIIYKVIQVIKELSITPQAFASLALKVNATFFIYRPDNTEIYLIDDTQSLTDPSAQFFEKARRSEIFPPPPLRVSPEATLLCLQSSDLNSIMKRGEFQKKEFKSVALFDDERAVASFQPIEYVRYAKCKNILAYALGTFKTFHSINPASSLPPISPRNEKTLSIQLSDLLISTVDLQAIQEAISKTETDYGIFIKGDWTSTKLARLNEASTRFFSQPENKNEQLPSNKKDEIKNWFRSFPGIALGADLLEQSVNAIIPDREYPQSPAHNKIDDELRGMYNTYASTSLIIINESARRYFEHAHSGTHKKFAKRETIIRELQKDWGFSAKLATAAATIIRPDTNK